MIAGGNGGADGDDAPIRHWLFSIASTLALSARLRYRVAGPIESGGIADDARL
jgi:hypothetical protein